MIMAQNIIQRFYRLAAALLTVVIWLTPQGVWAADGLFDTPSQAFTWYVKGQGCLHMKILIHDASAKRSLKNGYFAVKGEDIADDFLFVSESTSGNANYMVTEFQSLLSKYEQLIYLTNDYNVSPLYYIGSTKVTRNVKRVTSGGESYAEFDWYYPSQYAGKKLTFYLHGASIWEIGDGRSHTYTAGNKDLGTIEFDEIGFETYDIIPGTEEGEDGTVKVPFTCDRVINWVEATYTDEYGNQKEVERTTLPSNSYSGYLKLPATEAHKDLKITANVVSGKPNDSDISNPEWKKTCTGNITKEIKSQDDAVIHNPRMLIADVLPLDRRTTDAGAVRLRWKVRNPEYTDLLDGDQFLVERSLTGREEDFLSLGGVMFDSEKEEYAYQDSTLIAALTPELIDQRLGIPLVRYRVVRASTKQLWGIKKNPTAAYVQPQFAPLSLLQPTNAKAVWSDTEERKIRVTWNYKEGGNSRDYVWDSRATMTLRLMMYDRSNRLLDSLRTELTDAQIQAREMEVTLTRSCVKYKLFIDVEGKTSPIGKGTGDIFVPIGNQDEYINFVRNNYRPDANIILTNSFTLTENNLDNISIGASSEKMFTGNFNGNGYRLYFNCNTTQDDPAFFRYIGNGATIVYLSMDGDLKTSKKFAGGIVSQVLEGSVFIENCRSSANMTSSISGDASNGGLIGLVASDAQVNISNIYCSPQQRGTGATHYGGLVGWRMADAYVRIANSESHLYLSTWSRTGIASFMRDAQTNSHWAIIEDCYWFISSGTIERLQGYKGNMPDNWCWNMFPIVRQVQFSTPESDCQAPVTSPTDQFYFENLGHIDVGSLTLQTLQSSVLLRWHNVDDQPVDYYEVWRRDVKEKDFKRLTTQLIEMQYEDKSTSPVHNYEYFVRGVNSCEGEQYEDTDTLPGCCVQTGMVEGYLRFPDGTGIPGYYILITSSDNGVSEKAITDESGYYRKEGLPYFNNTETTYTAAPDIEGFTGSRNVTFGTLPGDNSVKDITFVMEKSVKFSGYVQYSGTSIPVQGVTFKLDNRVVHTASGKVTTDHEGKFSFRMLEGDHKIQAFKDGHVFYQKGYYHENEDTTQLEYYFSVDKTGVMFYDDTRVKLIGRIAGGKDQEALPLDNSLSRNNLGDDLQMVLTLEGDNTSRLVWDIQDRNKKERDEVFHHTAHDTKFDYHTQVHTTLNRMVVKPDVHTGEYVVWLPPVKWKIQQITARGYATLFQDGKTGDVIDLTDSIKPHTDRYKGKWTAADLTKVEQVDVKYHAIYNRIYHTPVLIEYNQINYDNFDYLGEHYYSAKNLAGESAQVPLCYPVRKEGWPVGKRDSLEAHYTFGYPVFRIENKYPLKISAIERYYYNNDTKNDTIDIVRLSGGTVTIQNGLLNSTHRQEVPLDEEGEAIYYLEAKKIPYLLTEKDALRTVTMTLLMDGTHYEATPLRAYILNQTPVPGAKDILTINKPTLIDILRDPPGGGSSAKLSKGSTLKYAHDFSWNVKGGLSLGLHFGHQLTTLMAIGVGSIVGTISNANDEFAVSVDLIFSGSGKEAWSYTMTNNLDISTSSLGTMVGADADVYIGTENSFVMKPTVAIRAITESMWKKLQGEAAAGRLVEIACGYDENGDTLHLVRDEIVGIENQVTATFAHSQFYIVNQLIPKLKQECKSLLFTGSKAQAQSLANTTGKNVYLSLRKPDDPEFGVVNSKKQIKEGDETWEYVFNTTKDKAEEGINYLVVRPEGNTEEEDRIADFSQSMLYWAAMIAQNEQEKLSATEKVKTLDIDGGSPVSYSEDFASDFSASGELKMPWDGGLSSIAKSMLGSLANWLNGKAHSKKEDELPHFGVDMPGYKFGVTFGPIFDYSLSHPYSESKKYNRKESFTISMDRKSHLVFDVLRAKSKVGNPSADGKFDVFVNKNYNDLTNTVKDEVKHGSSVPTVKTVEDSDLIFSKSFVYRTIGGATCRPWEGERQTLFYNGGQTLDERTKKIENPTIQVDRQSLSGVPYGEPARFKLYLANESEVPEAAYPYFDLYQVENTNPKGAKLLLDGMPLSGNARTMEINPGTVTEKTLEVYASEDFDYEDIRLRLRSQNDIKTFQEVQFSVHFLQTAGSVDISTPGDKWIMNTDAPYDAVKGWYMPVVISGFNKTQHNFDHIEFQYKEATRGDDYWTNLCGFYADSTLYRAASGTKEMIPENGNIVTRFYGEGVVMEKAYDLRAVLFCRNGNGFLTNSSKVLTGVKDTRRPQLFGTPEPKDGVLGAGENIVFSFSEGIEYNYLQATTNFVVKGETNETSIQEEPSLLFSKKSYAQSEASRNFSDKSVTVEVMIKPEQTNRPMPIFSHGRDGKQLQLWLTADRRLRAVVDDKAVETTKPMEFLAFKRVALSIDNDLKRLTLFGDNEEVTLDSVIYSGYGPIIFGSTNQTDYSKREFYNGRMLQGRIWNRAMTKIQLNAYANQLLTGYEMGLTAYYPMNEGRGDFAKDEAMGAHLTLHEVAWSQPRGMSLFLDKNEKREIKGLQIKSDFIDRTAEQDYTLMFWFKTDEDGRGALLANGSGRKTDVKAQDKFFIGFEGETLKYRSNGREFPLGTTFSDGAWHHYAMTVNRSHQVVSIYVDDELKAQFPTDSLGGISGKTYIGNMVWQEEGLHNDVIHQQYPLTGHIDGLALFEQALPLTLIKRYTDKSLGGMEKGLVTFMGFNSQQLQKNGELTLQPFALNQKVKYDSDGQPTEVFDSVFTDPVEDILKRIDRNVGAPMQAYEELRNLNFSYVGRDHQLLLNIDELDSRINKRTVYVTVSDIPDLNGNFMASPKTMAVFIDRNPLRWTQKTYKATMEYGGYEDYTFDINIANNSGAAHTYKVEHLPKWLSVNVVSDVIEPQTEQTLTFSINKDVNVGSYDDVIYLTDENGLSEPMMLNITVEGRTPTWWVYMDQKQFSMNIVGQVMIEDDIVTDSRDVVGVFDSMGRCMGIGNVNYNPVSSESLVYLTVFDSLAVSRPIGFQLWHYATGKTMVLTPSEEVIFSPDTLLGTTKKPLILRAGMQYIQTFDLSYGWNWISLNVASNAYRDVEKLLRWFDWQDGDMLMDDANNLSLLYYDGEWLSNKGKKLTDLMLSISHSYRVKVGRYAKAQIVGDIIKQDGDRTIPVKTGWNSIGYTPMVNLPVATALADYLDEATDGDVVKSQTEFAMFTEGDNGSREWKGNLQYMKPGEGYMLYRQKKGETKFIYPFFEPNATFFEENGSRRVPALPAYAHNMTMVAETDGIELQEGDKLIAFSDAEVRGEATGSEGSPFYISIFGDKEAPLSFAIERDGDIIATSGEVLSYQNNAVSGSPEQPTVISFVPRQPLSSDGWYSVQGHRLTQRPTRRGVYIFNGKKVVIK